MFWPHGYSYAASQVGEAWLVAVRPDDAASGRRCADQVIRSRLADP